MKISTQSIIRLINSNEANVLYPVLNTSSLMIVGGAVRDLFCGNIPKDLDFASVLTPTEVMERLAAANIPFVETGIRRGTITALIDHVPVEITTFRKPENEKEFSDDIDVDLSARDFTINAIAIRVMNGEIIDPYDGLSDIENKILKAVGEPTKRFKEDPHRILRMIRFAYSKPDWNINLNMLSAAEKCAYLIETISVERIRDELIKILLCDFPSKALRTMTNFGIMKYVIPELVTCKGFEQNHYHTLDVFEHILAVVDGSRGAPINRLSALFHDIGKPASMSVGDDGIRHFIGHEDTGATITENVMKRLKFSNDDIYNVKKLVSLHMRPVNMGPKGIRKLIMQIDELLPEWLDLKQADFKGGHTQNLDEFEKMFNRLKDKINFEIIRTDVPKFSKLAVNGNDMINLGLKGPLIGQTLNHLQELVIEEPAINVRETMLFLAKKFKDSIEE